MKKYPIKMWENPVPVALPITAKELQEFGIDIAGIETGEVRGKLKTYGPWQSPVLYTALAMSAIYSESFFTVTEKVIVYGMRTLTNCRNSDYVLEGYVSINGKKYSAFTSSQLFEIEGGKLVDIAIIHARVR